jgi:hypothetical protein
VEQANIEQVKTGKVGAFLGGYVELVVQPLCEVGVFAMFEGGADSSLGAFVGAMRFGALFEPSSACRKERTTAFGLREKRAEAAPPAAAKAPVVPATSSPSGGGSSSTPQ